MKDRGMSQRRLGKLAGLTQPTVNRYCCGHCDMTGENLDKLLGVLGLKIKR